MKIKEIPADVPKELRNTYLENYNAITKNTNRLFLFAADQKIEHLNKDFYGEDIPKEVNDPEHLFKIASQGEIGAFVTQLGLISQYGKTYPDIKYIVKLNSKTNLISKEQKDPLSDYLWEIEQIVEFKKNSRLGIFGVGYTVYIGSEFENTMLKQAAKIIYKAHQHGLVTILWIYPRGKNVKNEKGANVIAGAAGVAACLDADFAKINPPQEMKNKSSAELLQQATQAAGKTKIICSGGPKKDETEFLKKLYDQIHIGKTAGNATGRNIFQRTLKDAIAFTKAISAIVYANRSVGEAYKVYETNK